MSETISHLIVIRIHIRFTPKMLMEKVKNVGLVIDFTDTKRYYDGKVRFNTPLKFYLINLTKFDELWE